MGTICVAAFRAFSSGYHPPGGGGTEGCFCSYFYVMQLIHLALALRTFTTQCNYINTFLHCFPEDGKPRCRAAYRRYVSGCTYN